VVLLKKSLQKNAVKAATYKRANSESYLSWVPEKTDVILSKRETRSSKPEVVYRLSDASAAEPLVSPGAPSLESIEDLPGSPLQPLALEEVFHNTPPHSPQVNLLPPLPVFPQYSPLPPVPVVIPGLHPGIPVQIPPLNFNPPADNNNIVEQSLQDIDMAEERSMNPVPFTGQAKDPGAAEEWLRHFINYCQYREYNDDRPKAVFKVLMVAAAGDWLESLSAATRDSWALLKEAFNSRYKAPDVVKFRSAKQIFSRKQGSDESVDQYYTQMRKLGKDIEVDDKMLSYAIINGLKSHISAYVTQQKATTLDILKNARIAELTAPAEGSTSDLLVEQLADTRSQLNKMNEAFMRATATPVGPYQQPVRPQQSFRGGGQGGWQGQRTPRPYWAGQNPRGQEGPQTNFGPRAMMGQFNRWRPSEPTTSSFQRQRQLPQQGQMGIPRKCNKCGRSSHQHPNYCPAINSNCNVM